MNLSKNVASKIFRFWLLSSFLFVFCSVSLNAQVTVNAEVQAKLVSEFDVNGLKVIFKRRISSPTVAVGLFLRGGVKNINSKTAGIENLALSVATEAGKKFSRQAVRKESARTGSGIGAGVSNDFSVISLGSTRQNFEKSWDIFTDVTLNPLFASDDIERIRGQILTSLRDDSDEPESFLQTLVDKTINENHPYSNNPRGTIETISKFSEVELRSHHQTIMQTSRLLLVIVGDLEINDLRLKIANSFGKLPRGIYKETPVEAIKFAKPTLDITTRSLPTNYIKGEFSAPNLSNIDYHSMRVAISILQSRVFQEVRVKRNLSYAPGADIGSLAANSANISVSAVDANRSVSIMLNEIKKMQTELVDETDISGVSGQFLTNFYMSQETNAAQAAELARYELIGGGWINSLTFLDRVKKVSPNDVKNVSQKYMKNIRFVVVGDPAAISREIFLQQ
jgi:zinc protease